MWNCTACLGALLLGMVNLQSRQGLHCPLILSICFPGFSLTSKDQCAQIYICFYLDVAHILRIKQSAYSECPIQGASSKANVKGKTRDRSYSMGLTHKGGNALSSSQIPSLLSNVYLKDIFSQKLLLDKVPLGGSMQDNSE